ncbi:hypothetical protein HYT18_03850 [Candidatus Microgenomates bacterium]|nr:hypothetical protein [Candidatus Microgenomates bacterium]
MKYDSQISELKNLLPTAKSVLIALPVGADIDKLAAALALFLVLEASGKEVTVVSDDTITVGQSHLFGVDHISKNLPSGQGGNLTLTLEGVASSNGTIPALEKLDWYAQNNNLNLVFHVIAGQMFRPSRIVSHYQGSGFNLNFVVGAANLDSLGSIYKQNSDSFSGVHIVNIDNQGNTGFGTTNILDTNASSISDIMANLIIDLGLNLDADAASNLLTGIFDATNNLSDPRISADTYMVVANLLRAGGKKPFDSSSASLTAGAQGRPATPQAPRPDLSALIPPELPLVSEMSTQPVAEFTPIPIESGPIESGFTTPPVVSQPAGNNRPSPEERPVQEGVVSETIEPEWLTPKIFKGTSLG